MVCTRLYIGMRLWGGKGLLSEVSHIYILKFLCHVCVFNCRDVSSSAGVALHADFKELHWGGGYFVTQEPTLNGGSLECEKGGDSLMSSI